MVHFEQSEFLGAGSTVADEKFAGNPSELIPRLLTSIGDLSTKLASVVAELNAGKQHGAFKFSENDVVTVEDANLISKESKSGLEVAKIAYKTRRLRDRKFGKRGLFSDPAWDILLDLYISKKEGRQISTTSACIAACVPTTTALRWISVLEQEGLIVKGSDKSDKRRNFVEITDIGSQKIEATLLY